MCTCISLGASALGRDESSILMLQPASKRAWNARIHNVGKSHACIVLRFIARSFSLDPAGLKLGEECMIFMHTKLKT